MPHVIFADERLGEFGAKLEGEAMCGEVVGEDVGVGGCEKRRRLEEDNLVWGYEFREVSDDVRL